MSDLSSDYLEERKKFPIVIGGKVLGSIESEGCMTSDEFEEYNRSRLHGHGKAYVSSKILDWHSDEAAFSCLDPQGYFLGKIYQGEVRSFFSQEREIFREREIFTYSTDKPPFSQSLSWCVSQLYSRRKVFPASVGVDRDTVF